MVKRILAGLVMAACTLGASAANVLPTVSISNPAANASYPVPGVITLKANALDTDGTISKVEYYNGTTLIGEAVTTPYTYVWGGVPINVYNVTAKATDNLGGVTTSAAVRIEVKANVPPTVTFTAPANNAAFAAPGVIALKSTATDVDGSVAKVTYFNGASAIGYASVAPYAVTWSNVAAGSYTITAKATDDKGIVGPAASVEVVVNPAAGAVQVFYIYADQINTAREITNAAGVKVWQADSEPFGANLPNENPAGQGQFTYNPRFPGQYYDRETGLHYNYYRDYDPQTGRYVQSDPIGLDGGLNTYGYVRGNPTEFIDPRGLADLNVFNPSQPQFWGPTEKWNPPGVYSVGGHGAFYNMSNEDDRTMWPHELAERIRSDKKFHGQRIVLASCNVNNKHGPSPNEPTFAQRLANYLSTDVTAPNDFIYPPRGDLNRIPPSGEGGVWHTVHPDPNYKGRKY